MKVKKNFTGLFRIVCRIVNLKEGVNGGTKSDGALHCFISPMASNGKVRNNPSSL